VPPHSIEAEQAVLGGILINNRALETVLERLGGKHFYRHDHEKIFECMHALAEKNKPIDIITVSEALEQTDLLDEVGGMAYLSELARNTPSAANIGAYADIVYERSILRQLVQIGGQITESGFSTSNRPVNEILGEAEQRVFDIAQQSSRGSGPVPMKEVVANALDTIETLSHAGNALTGLSTGFTEMDRMTRGLQAGELVIIAGRPSMGKTILAMNIAQHASLTQDKIALVFSMEMPSESIAVRSIASLGRIDMQRLQSGQLQEEDWARVSNAVGFLNNSKMVIDETPALSPMEIQARARRVAREAPLGLIVVDYLQLMRGSSNRVENRTAEISEISRSLKTIAKELNVPVIALSQLNRSLEQRPNKRPVMSDLRESGAIEQDADLIAFIYRDEVYHEDSEDKGTAEIIIGKQRNGPIGMFRLTFLGQYTRFENFTQEQNWPSMEE
jgi:replicative DNA helicase